MRRVGEIRQENVINQTLLYSATFHSLFEYKVQVSLGKDKGLQFPFLSLCVCFLVYRKLESLNALKTVCCDGKQTLMIILTVIHLNII